MSEMRDARRCIDPTGPGECGVMGMMLLYPSFSKTRGLVVGTFQNREATLMVQLKRGTRGAESLFFPEEDGLDHEFVLVVKWRPQELDAALCSALITNEYDESSTQVQSSKCSTQQTNRQSSG